MKAGRIAPQARLAGLQRWRSSGLVIRYQFSDVGAVARSSAGIAVGASRSDVTVGALAAQFLYKIKWFAPCEVVSVPVCSVLTGLGNLSRIARLKY